MQHIAACGVLSQHLSSLAREHPEAKFLRAKASELDFATQDAEVVLPTLLIYQAGELIGNLVAVDLEWERSLDYESEQVEDVLQRSVLSFPFARTDSRRLRQADYGRLQARRHFACPRVLREREMADSGTAANSTKDHQTVYIHECTGRKRRLPVFGHWDILALDQPAQAGRQLSYIGHIHCIVYISVVRLRRETKKNEVLH